MKVNIQYISGGTVLIVDDGVDICLLMKAYFLRRGSRVYISHTLIEAFQVAAEVLPDAIFIGTPCDNIKITIDNFLFRAPDVQLITLNFEIIYEK